MSGSGRKGLATLLRWREFQESGAANHYRQCHAATVRCREAADRAESEVRRILERRDRMLASSELDITGLQWVAQFEEVARSVVSERQAALAEAEDTRDGARDAHVEARARTRVVDARRQRAVREEHERAEKVSFDRMADLLAARRREA